jgi:hypothetical protein
VNNDAVGICLFSGKFLIAGSLQAFYGPIDCVRVGMPPIERLMFVGVAEIDRTVIIIYLLH